MAVQDRALYLNTNLDQSLRETQQVRVQQHVGELDPEYFQFGEQPSTPRSEHDAEMEEQFARTLPVASDSMEPALRSSFTAKAMAQNYVRPQSVTNDMAKKSNLQKT